MPIYMKAGYSLTLHSMRTTHLFTGASSRGPSSRNLMNELRIVFACFRKFHLRIKLEKTKAILKIAGHVKHSILKHYVRKNPTGRRLLLMPGDPSQWISLVPQAEHLGLIISYDHLEQQALRHRIQKAHGRRWALASILHSPKVSISYKLSVWQSCVYSTMMYGLSTCGINGDQVRDTQRAIMKHVRAQAHLTGDTHETIVAKYNIPQAVDDLQRELLRAADNRTGCMMKDGKSNLCRRLQQCSEGPERDDNLGTFQWACPFCSDMFPTQAALKIHAQRTHKHIDKTDITFNKALHSVGGLPTCRFCNKKFSRWQTLSQHITANRCPKHMPAQPVDNDATYAHMPKNPADPGIPVQINDEPHSSTQASPATCIEVGTSVISQQTGGCCSCQYRPQFLHPSACDYQSSHADMCFVRSVECIASHHEATLPVQPC